MAQSDGDLLPFLTPTSPNIFVRAARLEDLNALTELLASSFYSQAGLGKWLYPVLKFSISEDLKPRLRSPKPYYACLAALQAMPPDAAISDQRLPKYIMGTVELSCRHPYPWQEVGEQHLYISNLAVRSDYRRQGVAQTLLTTCAKIAVGWGFSKLYLHVMEDNIQAQKLYYKCGFRTLRREETPLHWLGLTPRKLMLCKPLPQATRKVPS